MWRRKIGRWCSGGYLRHILFIVWILRLGNQIFVLTRGGWASARELTSNTQHLDTWQHTSLGAKGLTSSGASMACTAFISPMIIPVGETFWRRRREFIQVCLWCCVLPSFWWAQYSNVSLRSVHQFGLHAPLAFQLLEGSEEKAFMKFVFKGHCVSLPGQRTTGSNFLNFKTSLTLVFALTSPHRLKNCLILQDPNCGACHACPSGLVWCLKLCVSAASLTWHQTSDLCIEASWPSAYLPGHVSACQQKDREHFYWFPARLRLSEPRLSHKCFAVYFLLNTVTMRMTSSQQISETTVVTLSLLETVSKKYYCIHPSSYVFIYSLKVSRADHSRLLTSNCAVCWFWLTVLRNLAIGRGEKPE